MEQASVFKTNKNQAVRLPKAVALPEDVKKVDIVSLGRAILITPAGEAWQSWFDGEGVTDDFMNDREQPAEQERNAEIHVRYNHCDLCDKNKPQHAREAFIKHHGQMCISTVTLLELIYGAEKSANPERNLKEVEGFAARLDVLPYDHFAATHTGQLRAELAKQGKSIVDLTIK